MAAWGKSCRHWSLLIKFFLLVTYICSFVGSNQEQLYLLIALKTKDKWDSAKWAKWAKILKITQQDNQLCSPTCLFPFACLHQNIQLSHLKSEKSVVLGTIIKMESGNLSFLSTSKTDVSSKVLRTLLSCFQAEYPQLDILNNSRFLQVEKGEVIANTVHITKFAVKVLFILSLHG